jgi:hypothetical protein
MRKQQHDKNEKPNNIPQQEWTQAEETKQKKQNIYKACEGVHSHCPNLDKGTQWVALEAIQYYLILY